MKKVDPGKAYRLFYPQVPALLCARMGREVSAMPVVSYAHLSESPPLMGVSCGSMTRTLRLCTGSGAFSLCLLGKESAAAVAELAAPSREGVADKISAAGLEWREGKAVHAPVIEGAAAVVECTVESSVKTGDHVLLVGRIAGAGASPDFQEYWRFRDYEPILYTGWVGGLTTFPPSRRKR
jgi:flavin reductase (DIM6/NTAB) family NADH-FMN oxidoreductase RutF